MKKIKSIAFIVTLLFTSFLWAQSSPIPVLETTAHQIIAALDQNKSILKQNPQIIYGVVERYLLPHVDVGGMSRSVLGRQAWNKASLSERQQFTMAFTQLVIRTYSSPLKQYTNETIKFYPLQGSLTSRFLRVNSLIIRSNGQNIPLSYSLVSKNGEWKIFDLSIEGVSLLQSFHSQFAQALQNSSMQELIKEMQQHSNKAT